MRKRVYMPPEIWGIVVLTILLSLLAALAGCVPFEPAGAVLFQPPAHYLDLWQQVESCSGLRGNFGRIAWFTVEGGAFPDPETGRPVLGHWAPKHIISLAGTVTGGVYADADFIVKHEMLHDLIGHAGHPAVPFASPCHLTWASHE